jgi:TRAP-type C4-dicarboxylate transport system substrate-binding protein
MSIAILAAASTLAFTPKAEAKKVKIKLGTLAPEGSEWHNQLLHMAQRWEKASNGEVELKVYPGGVAGDEGDMVRKMRIGQLQAASVTGVGLGQITRAAIALAVPMMYDSWEQLDYVRDRIAPEIEKEMEKAGVVVLQWGDAGWVHQFSKVPGHSPDDFRKLKMFTWSGDPEAEKAWRAGHFNPVPLSTTDVMSGLQTGMITAFGATPIFALTSTWYSQAKYMLKLNWAPLNGATIIKKEDWEKIDEKIRPELLKIAKDEGENLKVTIRKMSDDAIKAMQDRGLVVDVPDPATVEQWRKAAQEAYGEIRGKVVPEQYFDQAQKLATEFKAKRN